VPLVQTLTLDGGYSGAVISQEIAPNDPYIGEGVKTMLVIARDNTALQTRIVSCLISEFGLSQGDAVNVRQTPLAETDAALEA
jgi:hypothetical protein